MRRIVCGLLVLISITGLCACNQLKEDKEEMTVDVEQEISQMEEQVVEETSSVSVASNVNENGELIDYIEVSVEDSYVETEKITKASLDLLTNVVGAFIDDEGNLLDGYSFVGIKLNIDTEKNLNVNTASFVLRAVNNGEYHDAGCFYHDGQRISDDVHQGGQAELQQGTTEITVGFFADKEVMESEKFLLVPKIIDTEDSQNNYIEVAIKKGNKTS